MLMLLLSISINCPKVKMINLTNQRWTKWDRNRAEYCQKKCPIEYSDSPCLKKFYKIGYQNYVCICGK